MRLVLMGTAAFAVPTLSALLDAGHDIACVYTRAPRPAGRGHNVRLSPVHALASERGIEVRTPERLDAAAAEAFAGLRAEAGVVAAYGLVLPRAILDAPRLGCVNLHASLLPRWRGAAPIQHAILAGDARTGVTAMQMDEGLDTGPLLAAREVAIPRRADAGRLHDVLADEAAALAVEVLDTLADGTLVARPQPSEGITHAAKIDPARRRIEFSLDPAAIERLVRALSPRPGAWSELCGERLRILGVEAVTVPRDTPPPIPGTTIDDALTVACEGGAIRLIRLQRGGRAALDAAAFLRGFAVPAGTKLGR